MSEQIILPHNLEAEQQLLGCALYENKVVPPIATMLSTDAFYQPVHGRIWSAVADVVAKGGVANPVTLKNFFDFDEALNELGGIGYLVDLTEKSIAAVRAEEYARILVDLHVRREIILRSQDTIERAKAGDLTDSALSQAGDVMGWSQELLYMLPSSGDQKTAAQAAKEVASEVVRGEMQRGIPYGLAELTEKTGGMISPDLIVVGARPSMGKSAFALTIAKAAAHAARDDDKQLTDADKSGGVCVISYEMTTRQISLRQISDACFIPGDEIPYFSLLKGEMKEGWSERIEAAADKFAELPIIIDDGARRTVEGAEAAARSADKKLREAGSKLGLIIIDYLGLMTGKSGRNISRQQEIAGITSGLKEMGKRLGVPIVLLHQVGRSVETRDDKRPQLSDLREAGDVEQDADVVLFLYREHYYEKRNAPKKKDDYQSWLADLDAIKNDLEIIIAKQRQGPTGSVTVYNNLASNRIQTSPPRRQNEPQQHQDQESMF